MMFVAHRLTVTPRAIRIAGRHTRTRLTRLWAVLVLIAVWFTVVQGAVGIAGRRVRARSRVWTDLVLISVSIPIPVTATLGRAIRIATRCFGTGLLRLRTVLVLVLVAHRLTVTRGTIGVASGRPGARLIGLWTKLVLVASRLTFSFWAIWVAARQGGHSRLRWCLRRSVFGMSPTEGLWILQTSLGFLPGLIEHPGRLAQWLLGWLRSVGLDLFQRSLLIMNRLLRLGQGVEHGIVR